MVSSNLIDWNSFAVKMIKDYAKFKKDGEELFNYFYEFILPELKKEKKQAEEYYNSKGRLKQIQLMAEAQKKAIEEVTSLKYNVVPCSSFTAGTSLAGESDIDLIVPIKNLDEEKLQKVKDDFQKKGYKFVEQRGNYEKSKRWAFKKYIKGIEIDLVARDEKNARVLIKIHKYLDSDKMTKEEKMLYTYGKHKLKIISKKPGLKKAYQSYKFFYYGAAAQAVGENYIFDVTT